MKKQIPFKVELFQIAVSLFIVVITAMDLIGKPARLVIILTITAASISVGIAIGRLIERKRRDKLDARPVEQPPG